MVKKGMLGYIGFLTKDPPFLLADGGAFENLAPLKIFRFFPRWLSFGKCRVLPLMKRISFEEARIFLVKVGI